MDAEYRNTSVLRKELNDNFKHVVLPVTVFICVEMFFGFIGNISILFVYSHQNKRTNFRYFVLSMATVDLISCLTTLPGEIFSQLNWYDYKYGWICKTKSYFNIFTAWASASILLILAFDRYRKICHPLRWQLRQILARRLCFISLIVPLFVSAPVVILWGKHEYSYGYNGENVTISVCEKSSQYADSIYPFVYIGSVYFLPLGAMIFVAGSLIFMTAWKLIGYRIHEAGVSSSSSSATTTVVKYHSDSNGIVRNCDSSENQCSGKLTDISSVSDQSFQPNATEGSSTERHLERSRRRVAQMNVVRKRKTVIMLILTSVFIATMTVYVVLTSLVAKPDGILDAMSDSTKVVFFFFWRLYFINCVVNPILYGFMDPRFRTGLLTFFRRTIAFAHALNFSHSSH